MEMILRKLSYYLAERQKFTEAFFVIFYTVGFFGITNHLTHDLFIRMFPSVLIVSTAFVFLFHGKPPDIRTILVYITIGLAGYIIEVIGVSTGLIFGNYRYGETLGLRILETPLLIGINWIMLTYASSTLTEEFYINSFLKILIGGAIMLAYDIILEQIAPALGMWYWEEGPAPFQNYVAWFLTGAVFQAVVRISGITAKNRLAWKIMVIQALFFTALILN